MAKKGKEIEFGSIRIQIDPFILIQRVLMRQKLMLVLVAVIGGAVTIFQYKQQPKIYASSGQISVRTENMDADFARKFVNRSMRTVASNEELSLIINELDLFAGTRATEPYSIAVRRMKRELNIKSSQGSIEVIFESRDPSEAYRVVAFAVERVLATFERLLYEPYDRQIEALNRAIAELMPKVELARAKLFEFKAKHPSIAIKNPDFIADDSPMGDLQTKIKAAEASLSTCFGARPAGRVAKDGPACTLAKAVASEKVQALNQYTANHPTVAAIDSRLQKAKAACAKEQSEDATGIKPGMSRAQCVSAANARIKALHREMAAKQAIAFRKPRLQQEWTEISADSQQLESQVRTLKEKKANTFQERVMGSSNFTDNFSLVDPPRLPDIPVKPDRNRFLMTGIVITAILGILLAVIREALRQKFLDPKEFEEQTGLDVLAVLPDIND